MRRAEVTERHKRALIELSGANYGSDRYADRAQWLADFEATAREEGKREGLEMARGQILMLPANSHARMALDIVRVLLDAPEAK